MPSFAQTHSRVTTYFLLDKSQDLKQRLTRAARWKKPVLMVPALASEFTDPENRPVFERIVAELSEADYLAHVIFGLDQATERDVRDCIGICKENGLSNYVIQWNDGPAVSGVYNKLQQAGFDLSRRGKGTQRVHGVRGGHGPGRHRGGGSWTPTSVPSAAPSLTACFSRCWSMTILLPRPITRAGTDSACSAGSSGCCSTPC